jgi:signal transduction histidine kinase
MLHDLGSPLSVIGSHVDLILQSQPESGIERRLTVVQSQAEHCRGIIRSAMGFLQHPTSEFVDLNVNEVFDNCRQVAQPLLAKEGVSLECELSPDVPFFGGDFVLVRQAILNLVTNACHAVAGLDTPREVRVRTYREGDWTCLSVEDTGPGIAPEKREEVFKAFYTTKGEAGTGLGLVAVQNVMNRHKGEVALEEASSGGARFVLRFPAKSVAGAAGERIPDELL